MTVKKPKKRMIEAGIFGVHFQPLQGWGVAKVLPPMIVVVEDDLGLQELVQELLADEPVAVSVFAEGPAALDFCRENAVSVVIVDLTLQGPWNGERVLEELRATPKPPWRRPGGSGAGSTAPT